jgi:hypothetical protein
VNRVQALSATAISSASLVLGACTTGLGPHAVRADRPDYNQQIVRSADSEMLLNLVRLRYDDTPLFLELGAVVSQYNINGSINAAGTVDAASGSGTAAGSATLGYSESPTITYSPLTGEEFAERMLTPIPLDAVLLFIQSGWSPSRIMLLAMQRVNDLFNAPTATGPIPEAKPEYEAFADFAERFQRLYRAHLAGLNWERKVDEKDPPGRDPHFWIRTPTAAQSELSEDVDVVRRLLELDPKREDFALTGFPFHRKPDEVGMRCRSLLGVLYFLASSVEPPASDQAAGLVTITHDERGQPFDWSALSGELMKVRSQESRPENAYVAVPYRGSWFYIADDDRNSKSTFGLLNLLFSLQSATGKGKSPLLTLPIGQ